MYTIINVSVIVWYDWCQK